MRNKIIEIQEEVQIGDVILEKGDRIEVLIEGMQAKKMAVISVLNNFIKKNQPMPVKDQEKVVSMIEKM